MQSDPTGSPCGPVGKADEIQYAQRGSNAPLTFRLPSQRYINTTAMKFSLQAIIATATLALTVSGMALPAAETAAVVGFNPMHADATGSA
ncbi:hypothetical protein SCP_0312330 [Sparassis crispa]|uniref:Uncharacterized protein n=1 Tax=Sparassis crispa TaxID=139825 RepID=A0A401GH27_9APHY|nr:hypothetical protein SCP_0312330 [Sparassis crispa]GBE81504.1 hypothetical protein SCP_0312330 [Sparassis crispa]